VALELPQLVTHELDTLRVEIEPMYDATRRRVIARSVRVAAGDGEEVTSTALHSVRLKELLRRIATDAIRISATAGESDDWSGIYLHPASRLPLTEQKAAELRSLGPSRETVEAVALIYRIAEITGDAPVRAVQAAFGIPRGTAASWVVRARAAGYLSDGDPTDGIDQAEI